MGDEPQPVLTPGRKERVTRRVQQPETRHTPQPCLIQCLAVVLEQGFPVVVFAVWLRCQPVNELLYATAMTTLYLYF